MSIPLLLGENSVTLTPTTPVVRYSVTVVKPLKCYSVSNLDTFCTLYDSALNVIGQFDDYNGDRDFYFEINTAGIHYLDITLYGAVNTTVTFSVFCEQLPTVYDRFDFAIQNRRMAFLPFDFAIENRRMAFLPFNFALNNQRPYTVDSELINRLAETTLFNTEFKNRLIDATDVDLKNTARFVFEFNLNNTRSITIKKDVQLNNALINIAAFDVALQSYIGMNPVVNADFRLLNQRDTLHDSVVIDLHKPENPIYGSYE